MSDLYRLSWEMVDLQFLRLYSDADPSYYKNTAQTVPNSQIPDEHWSPISKETDDPSSQYDQLKRWADADEQFVRNVRLERMVSTPALRGAKRVECPTCGAAVGEACRGSAKCGRRHKAVQSHTRRVEAAKAISS